MLHFNLAAYMFYRIVVPWSGATDKKMTKFQTLN